MKAVAFACLLYASPLVSQALVSRTLDSAAAVRVLLVGGGAVQGVLLAPLGPDATAIAFAPPPHRACGVPRALCRFELPAAEVRAVQVQRGAHTGRGALIGAGIGALAGLMLGFAVADYDTCVTVPGGGCDGPSDVAIVSLTTVLGTALGAGVGAVFGLGSPRWEAAISQ